MNVIQRSEGGYTFFVQDNAGGVIDEVVKEDCYCVDCIPKGSTVVDVGANIGTFSIRCARERECKVFAFEPNLENFGLLCRNVRLNLVSRVIPVHAAVGMDCSVRSFVSRNDHPAGSMFLDLCPDGISGDIEHVACLDMFSIAAMVQRDFVLKLDCEGAETEVLTGLSAWLAKSFRCIMEWHNHDGWAFEDLFKSFGFKTYLCGGGPPPRPEYDRSIGGGLLYAWRE
jgi:FkbM family methyltransferase